MDHHNLLKEFNERFSVLEDPEDGQANPQSYHGSKHILDDMKRQNKKLERMQIGYKPVSCVPNAPGKRQGIQK